MEFATNSVEQPTLFPENVPYRRNLEGSWVWNKNGWYYLFYSGDWCCGPQYEYAVMVARSKSILGPWSNDYRWVVLLGNQWIAPGHNSIITDDNGDDWIFYHGFYEPEGFLERKLLLDRLQYDPDGWPYVAGFSPSNSTQTDPLIKQWWKQ